MLSRIIVTCFLISISICMKGQETKTAVTSKQALITDEINLSPADIALFKEQTNKKVNDFEQYIITIGNKDEPDERRSMAEKEALKLFYKGAQMEITYILPDGTVNKVPRPMEKYLARLRSLPYTKVVIKFYDIAYVSDFKRGVDGRYYSTATIIQEFDGFTNDDMIYSDVTKKEIEIIIDLVEDTFYKEKRWKVFLGDIKATETRSATKTIP